MFTKRIITPLIAGVLLIGLSACGSDDESSSDATEAEATTDTEASAEPAPDATATDATVAASGDGGEGSPFCQAAQAAEDTGEEVNLDTAPPEELEASVAAAIEAAKAAQSLAPDEIAGTIATLIEYQERFAAALAASDWDLAIAATSPELAEIGQDIDIQTAGTDLDTYLFENCGMPID